MCGLTAIFAYRNEAPSVDREELVRIREHMINRGPDDAGLWIPADQRIGFGFRRLAIIDLSEAGAQPMATSDGAVRIVFNGEIYNYREQRRHLEAKGYQFRSNSDTEVLLHLYQEYGSELVHHLRGMYAFAIWDERKRGLLLARDPFGIKPLYVADDGKTLRVASQVKALLAGGKIDTACEPAGHVGFFLWGHVPEPYTLYKGIRALAAGTTMWIDTDGKKETREFFNIADEFARANATACVITPDEIRERLGAALRDSVRHHLIADVPVGVFLSAGLDSSTLLALTKESGVSKPLAVTLGFREFSGTENDEVPLAEVVARHYGATHSTQWVSKNDFSGQIDQLLAAMDQPSIDGVNSYFVCKAAKEAGLKVALSGLGGDELFGGYSDFQQIPRMVGLVRPIASVPFLGAGFRYLSAPLLKRFTSPKYAGLLEYGGDYGGAYLLRRGLFMPWELPDILDADMVRAGCQELQAVRRLDSTIDGLKSSHQKVSTLEMSWYMRNQLLRDTDWASMAHSLEVRVPLVDIELFRTVAELAGAIQGISKQDMSATVDGLPQAVLQRKKTGFSVPVREWLIESTGNGKSGRGLRGWATTVYGPYLSNLSHATIRPPAGMEEEVSGASTAIDCPPKRIGLHASEVCTRGGIQSVMLRIAETIGSVAQRNRAASGYCICLNDSTETLRNYPAMPMDVSIWGAARSKLNFIVRALAVATPADVVFVGHVGLASVARGLKALGRVHSYYVMLYGIEAWRRLSIMERNALLGAKGIIAISRYTAEECARVNDIPLERFNVIPLCCDERKVVPSPGFRLNGEFKLLCVARQDASERYKGFDHIFQALALLNPSYPGTHLNLVGDGNDQVRMKAVVRQLGMEPQVSFWGALSDEDLAAAYKDCDVFVMPSKNEGFGIVFLEAMRSGKPCIGGNHGGTPDVIENGKSGFLVEYGNVEELANQIRALIDDSGLRQAMGERGQALVADKFSARNFQGTYEKLMLATEKK
jgi:asparagine synthase (glutamine-hydrolysing)